MIRKLLTAACVAGAGCAVLVTGPAASAAPATGTTGVTAAATEYCPYGVYRNTTVRTGPGSSYSSAGTWHPGESHLVPTPVTYSNGYSRVQPSPARWVKSADIYRMGGRCVTPG